MKGHIITALTTIALTLAALALANRVPAIKSLVNG
jgi:hypothetical protein